MSTRSVIKINNVEVEDGYSEAFPMYFGRVIVTAITKRWALATATNVKGGGSGADIMEAGIEGEVKSENTPDGRPGYIVMFGREKKSKLDKWLIQRIRGGVVPVPTTSAFNAMPEEMAEDWIEVKDTSIQLFGDGYEEIVELNGRTVYKIPRMDGWFYIDTKFGVHKGVGGGTFFILGESQAATLYAAQRAVDAIREHPYVFVAGAHDGGPAASGSKVGGKKYTSAKATTNDRYVPCIADKVKDTLIPSDVSCVYEIIANGLTLDRVKEAMKSGIKAATTVQGIKKITTSGYGGKLGDIKIHLHDILSS